MKKEIKKEIKERFMNIAREINALTISLHVYEISEECDQVEEAALEDLIMSFGNLADELEESRYYIEEMGC